MLQTPSRARPSWKNRLHQEDRIGLSSNQRSRTRLRLFFSPETRAMRTRFRDGVLNYIFRAAMDLSDGKVKSADIVASDTPGEEDSCILEMTLTMECGWDTIAQLRHGVLVKVGGWSAEWSDEEREDYGRRIYFSFLPSEL